MVTEDVTPPEILEVSIHPAQIDVSDGPATVTITIKVDDDLSGISRGEFLFDSVPGISGGTRFIIPPTTGDSNYAELEYNLLYHQFFPSQTRHLLDAWIRDKAGNMREYSTDLLEELGLAASFEILPWVKEDDTPPELIEVTILSPVVDVSDSFAAVDISVRATDDESGVETVQLEFESPSGKHGATLFNHVQSLSGSPRDAVRKGSASVLQYSEAGTWKLVRAYLSDKLRNQRTYNEEELISLGISATFEVETSQQDLEPPLPVEFTIHTEEVDVTDGPGQIRVSVRVTDDLSGVARVQLDFESPSRDTELTLGGVLDAGWESYEDGLYMGNLTVPQGSESGTWNIKWIHLTDETGNWEGYHSSDLRSLGLFASFEVT